MGIKGLWNVLTPYSEKKSLHEIRGETVAVDLAGWVCDSQNVTDYHIQPKLYLRNLFFRTIYLLLADISPIFVLEGDAPELKRDIMAARNAVQFRGTAVRANTATNKKPDIARKRFKNVLKECESLLKCMGVRCVKGSGEAEATCAQLNAQGFVDAVVSQDSDCFAYGAKRVYRNFSVSNSAGGGALQGSVDCYDATKMFHINGFGRNKMVALALLCGCDYGVGACGSSINTVISFLHVVSEDEVIPRLLSWVTDVKEYEEKGRWVSVPGRCERCGHAGRVHARSGCPVCATHSGCNDTGHKVKVAEVKKELSLRNRALSCGMPFPEPKIIQEFLKSTPKEIDIDSLKSPTPSLIQFVKLMSSKLCWSERYCVEKFLPLLTKWHLQDHVPCRTIKPITIKKKRNPRGVPSYEVIWSDIDGQYEALIPDDQFEDDEEPSLIWTSTERQDLMRKYYPELVEAFEESIKKPVKVKKTRRPKQSKDEDKPKRKYNRKLKKLGTDEVAVLSDSMKNIELSVQAGSHNNSKINVCVKVNKLKGKLKRRSQRTIDSFIANKRRKSMQKSIKSLRCSFKEMLLANEASNNTVDFKNDDNQNKIENDDKENKKEAKHLLSMVDMSDDVIHESDLSDIVERIVSRTPVTKTAKIEKNLLKFIYNNEYSTPRRKGKGNILNEIHNNCSTPRESPVQKNKSLTDVLDCNTSFKANTSYFFDKLSEDRDAFELSLEYKHKSAISVIDCNTTLEYSLPDVCV